MKKRTLLLGPCGGCENHSTNKDRWKLIGKLLKGFNDGIDANVAAGMNESAAIAAALAILAAAIAAINKGNPPGGPLPGGGQVNPTHDLRDEYDQLAADCGF
jgi:hypothetical protein